VALAQPWIFYAALGLLVLAIAIGVAWGLLRHARVSAADAAPIARAERLRRLPSFAAAVRKRTFALSGILALGILAIGVGSLVAARPMAAQTIQPVNTNRDIMLCLDVSGSMTDVNIEMLEVFGDLIDGFEGERIGLTIFNSSPVQVFPLTDDYAFVREHLASIRSSFDYGDAIPEHWVGTLNGPGASLIGDGLAACAMRFGNLEEDRSRSVILATDNELNGASTVTLEEAAGFAKVNDIRVFAINPVDGEDAAVSAELVHAAELTGGRSFALRGTTTVSDIIVEVQREAASALIGEPQIIWSDQPNTWIVILLIAAGAVVLVQWRVRI
jgi:Ca-activated chloride channel family protein